jgi:hypothetical protein
MIFSFPSPSIAPRRLPVSLIHEFPLKSWIENLAIRSTNGHILCTVLSAPEIYQVNPFIPNPNPILVHRFTSGNAVLGIVELAADLFYVAVGEYDIVSGESEKGSYGIWEVDLRSYHPSKPSSAKANELVTVPDAELINGMTLLSSRPGRILAADSNLFAVWLIDIHARTAEIVIQDPLMASNSETPGINGLHVKIEEGKEILYYTNSDTGNYMRQPITSHGKPLDPSTIVTSGLAPDDFTFDKQGSAYLAENTRDKISAISPVGIAELVADVSEIRQLKGPTATAFGVKRDRGSLYISTSGGIPGWKSGNFTVGESLLRVDVGGLKVW